MFDYLGKKRKNPVEYWYGLLLIHKNSWPDRILIGFDIQYNYNTWMDTPWIQVSEDWSQEEMRRIGQPSLVSFGVVCLNHKISRLDQNSLDFTSLTSHQLTSHSRTTKTCDVVSLFFIKNVSMVVDGSIVRL